MGNRTATRDNGRRVCFILALCCSMSLGVAAPDTPAYRNPNLPVEQRINDLLPRMTLEEKVAQLLGTWQNPDSRQDQSQMFVGEKGVFLPDRAAVLLKQGLGQMSRPSEHRGPREMAEFTNTVQKWMKENTRLGIPVLFHEECLHGHAAAQGTSYPQAIALASTWDPGLVHDVFSATAAEVRARGAQQCLTPVLDLARDPRWGRTEETYGEDPYLVSRIGVAAVAGFQGNGPFIDASHVIATLKHFAVHGQPEGGTNGAPGNYSERVVREYFLKPFQAGVEEGHAQSVMASYNEIDGIPSHSNKHLLTDILRQEWGFNGIVVSDYFGIDDLRDLHHVAANSADAAMMALEAGVDVELPAADAYRRLVEQVTDGRIAESTVDRAVARVLREKFLTGLFDNPYVDPGYAEKITNSPEHRQLALQAAREAIILLKNQNNLLPLDKTKYKHIAVIGPNAADVHLGGYSNNPGRGVSVLQGIKDKVGSNAEVLYSLGCKITESLPDWDADKVVLGDPALNAKRIEDAVKVARKADIAILVLGGNEQTSREAWATNHPGDRDSLDLLGNQDDLVKAILATGKPVVVFLLHGRPNSINYVAENVPAILEGWYLGQEGGTAAADVLFGDYNPGGKLPITVPRSVGQLPVYYYQKPSAKREYLGTTTKPLFSFGWGLSYSTFKYERLRLSSESIGTEGQVKVSVDVTNTSKLRGDEVVQLYIRDEVSSVTRPVKELRGFRRITFDPGETRTVELTLGPNELSFLNREMNRVVEPGSFKIMIGGNSDELTETTLNVVAKQSLGVPSAGVAPKIAITFDDLPAHGPLPAGETRTEIISKIVAALQEANLPPTYGFVNGVRIEEQPADVAVLQIWHAAGNPLGNHSWSHMNVNDHSLQDFEQDVVRDEPVLASFMKDEDWRWLRYPFLAEGDNFAKRTGIRDFLREHGYRLAAVTMNFDDFLWNEPYTRCKAKGDTAAIDALENSFLSAASAKADYCRRISHALYQRDIPYVLLMHAGAFDAEMLPRLLQLYRSKGFEFIPLPEAERDEFYRSATDLGLTPGFETLEEAASARHLPSPARTDFTGQLDSLCR